MGDDEAFYRTADRVRRILDSADDGDGIYGFLFVPIEEKGCEMHRAFRDDADRAEGVSAMLATILIAHAAEADVSEAEVAKWALQNVHRIDREGNIGREIDLDREGGSE